MAGHCRSTSARSVCVLGLITLLTACARSATGVTASSSSPSSSSSAYAAAHRRSEAAAATQQLPDSKESEGSSASDHDAEALKQLLLADYEGAFDGFFLPARVTWFPGSAGGCLPDQPRIAIDAYDGQCMVLRGPGPRPAIVGYRIQCGSDGTGGVVEFCTRADCAPGSCTAAQVFTGSDAECLFNPFHAVDSLTGPVSNYLTVACPAPPEPLPGPLEERLLLQLGLQLDDPVLESPVSRHPGNLVGTGVK